MRNPFRFMLRELLSAIVYGGLFGVLVYASVWVALQNPVLDAPPTVRIAAHTESK